MQTFIDYLIHRIRSKTRHGVHSPSVYALIDTCIYADQPEVSKAILDHYAAAKKDLRLIKGEDLGKDAHTEVSVAQYARTAAIIDVQAALLHRFVHRSQPKKVLELGTNLGKSLACMASGAPSAECIGVEGNHGLAAYAQKAMSALGLDNARVVNASFEAYLSSDQGGYDVVFVDGDHRYEPTLRYFELVKSKMNGGGAIIFHDIYWSPGMKRAWAEIKKDRNVTVTIDLFFLGIAWMGKPQAKEDFSIRFPSSLIRLFF